ncbi:hypothetical protein B0J14DRAFT_97484 [Halenospora varia]|nr:hypothetical protein B0J14DRAFT_97484 [Halenospora varia]
MLFTSHKYYDNNVYTTTNFFGSKILIQMIHSHTMDILPPEILEIICAPLDREDLKSLRQLSRSPCATASRFLFSEVFLKFDLDSFQHFKSIADNPVLKDYVKSICYDPRRIYHARRRNWWETFKEENAMCTTDQHLPIPP